MAMKWMRRRAVWRASHTECAWSAMPPFPRVQRCRRVSLLAGGAVAFVPGNPSQGASPPGLPNRVAVPGPYTSRAGF